MTENANSPLTYRENLDWRKTSFRPIYAKLYGFLILIVDCGYF